MDEPINEGRQIEDWKIFVSNVFKELGNLSNLSNQPLRSISTVLKRPLCMNNSLCIQNCLLPEDKDIEDKVIGESEDYAL